ncbi:RxLR effector protein [Phytophthora megakarya]|uniref:RxLR effector protein n=1 Tax=Phytophthora megakarya TaxID=4795 RepID=A0A225UNB0_9STRA|nr:RxLR effector protein [Phytophthora megakarya]
MSILGVLVVIGIVLVAKSESVVLDSRTSIRTTSIEGNNESHPRPIATDFTDERVIPVSATDKLKLLLTKSTVSDKTFQDWLTKGETATNTFKLFRLTDAGENLFDNPQFRKWINYVDELNKWSRDKAESPIATLALQYDDSALFNMFSVAKTNPSTEDLAVTLQRQLLEYWVTNGKSPDDVFKVVGLYAAGKKVLEHPTLSRVD